ncbi:MAG: deoxynucleoside kinase, partial [Chitinophagaceae bacterium]|nr:deoxynucleoside kinase [Anaerolineae bacterium]
FVPPPDLIIYLQASVDKLMGHIAKRGRTFEQDIKADYIDGLNTLYENWTQHWTACPVLCINVDEMDFQHNPADYEIIVEQVEKALFSKIPQTLGFGL